MALRTVRLIGDEILTKPCREVKEMTPRLEELVEDMLETMYEADGIGLAAPQVGVLRRIVVIDIWQPGVEEDEEPQSAEDGDAPEGAPKDEEQSVKAEMEKDAGAAVEEARETAEKSAENEENEEAVTQDASGGDTASSEGSEEGEDVEEGPLIMINPVITKTEGEQTGDEGCLSLPGKVGTVTRPNLVSVTYLDENMEEYELEAEGLLARAICHEVDHLEGHTYVEFVEGKIRDAGHAEEEEEDGDGAPSEEEIKDEEE